MEFLAGPHLLVAPDKFRGTASAADVASAVAAVATAAGWSATALPLSDGGEGLLDVLGGPNRTTRVTGPSGAPVDARWLLRGPTAVIEAAEACGLLLAGGASGNDPVTATSAGVGELLVAARDAGATSAVVGLGGSACTDGGAGALRALGPAVLGDLSVTVCCDVETAYLDAARVFGPQKGATPEQVTLLELRLAGLRRELVDRFGVDPQAVVGSGAAGGLGGALAALGARLVPGLDHVADLVGLDDHVARADLVITGEGRLDASSLAGKVVGGVADRAAAHGVPVVAVVGDREPGLTPGFPVHTLVEEHGRAAALADTLACVRATTARVLASSGGRVGGRAVSAIAPATGE